MKKTCLGVAVSLAAHAAVIVVIFFAQSLLRENPVMAIEFTLEKISIAQPHKKITVQPRAACKLRPLAVEKKDVFPDTTKADTVHPTLAVVSDPTVTVSKQASPSVSYSADVVDSAVLKKEYLTAQYGVIRDKVYKALSYPIFAQEEGWQGTVKISFQVNPDGSVYGVYVLKSSGYTLLDNNAVKAVRQAAPFPYAPVRLQIILPVVYRLE